MQLSIIQTLALSLGVLAILIFLYAKLSNPGHETGLKRYTKLLIAAFGCLFFINLNLYSNARYDVHMREVVDKYGRTSTIELIALLRSTAKAEIGEGMIVFNRGTDQEKVFVVLHDPVFTIMDQSKLVDMQKELYPDTDSKEEAK